MNNTAFERISYLQYRLKAAEAKVASLESGEAYRKLRLGNRRIRNYYEKKLCAKDREIASLNRQVISNRDMWFQVFGDMEKECGKRICEKDREVEALKKQLLQKDEKIAKLKEKLRNKNREITEARAETNEEKEKNQKLQAQVNQNFGNSSTPSSQDPFRGKVPNSREKTGRKKGGQPGHEGHRRKQLEPTESIHIPPTDELLNNPDWYQVEGKAGKIHKQVIEIHFGVSVTDYWTDVFRNRKTGARSHAPFPEGVDLDVTYGDNLKATVFIMKNHLNVSADKICEFLKEMTDGKIEISHGKACNINREFAAKTKEEQDRIFADLATAFVMHTDMTNVRHNGKLKNVVVCSDRKNIWYGFRDNKGDKGLKGTPVEFFTGLLQHDHDKTFYHYGSMHQECNAHHMRYLKGVAENEPSLKWAGQMLELLLEANQAKEKHGDMLEKEAVEEIIRRYDAILDIADQEYHDNPPSRYYRKGYNLSKELRQYKEETLLFLKTPEADFTNNEAERCARKIKRHAAIAGSFRGDSNRSGEDYCKSMSVLETDRQQGENIFEKTRMYFGRHATINPSKFTEEPGSS